MADSTCFCGRLTAFDACCGAIHRGERPAITAEDLMRSRYSAFASGDVEYLRRSWDPDTCPAKIRMGRDSWTGLAIHGTTGGGAFDAEGTVHFTARYRNDGSDGQQTENSLFRRIGGVWVYVGAA